MLDNTSKRQRTIAVVGGGISGLAAAYYLSAEHRVTLYEAEPRLGGHARTITAGRHGTQPVDTGFIVFNYVTYPHLTRLFRDLGVPVAKSEMSFCASIDNGRIEYGLNSLAAIAGQRRNLLRPNFLQMISDILRFSRHAEQAAQSDDMSIDDLVTELRLGRWFRDYYLMPMCGAIWSTPTDDVARFPAKSLLRFFRNHLLLAGSGKHQWWTVQGGSAEYVTRLRNALVARGVDIHTGMPVTSVRRTPIGVDIATAQMPTCGFDDVIFACHSDQALALLGSHATKAERQALSAITYQPNTAVLHRDPSHMPQHRACWASWAYRSQPGNIGVTYWMNRLQNIPESDPLFVTLNPTQPVPEHLVYDQTTFAHPVFDTAAMRAQQKLREMQGLNNTWFAGAYHRHGFHEDGIASAMRIVNAINSQQLAERR